MTAGPYVGPRAFEEGETIYGRDREVNQLFDRLIADRIVLMYSPSGAGKTSLIQAGLIPRLREAKFVVRPIIRVSRPVGGPSPGGERNRYRVSTLASLEGDLPPDGRREPDDSTLGSYLDTRRQSEDDLELLVFDQFEDLLLDPTDGAAKQAFMAEVGEALRDRRRWALLAMREDRVAQLDPYLRLVPTRLASRYRLDLLDRRAARAAMVEPAGRRGVKFADAAADRLIENLSRVQAQTPQGTVPRSGEHVEPVQLQVVCRRLWDRRANAAGIEVSDVEGAGDVDDALGDYYDERIDEVVGATRISERDLRDWFSHELITRMGFRAQAENGPESGDEVDQARAVELLVDAHLVRSDEQRGRRWYELTHDRLIEPVRRRNAAWRAAHQGLLERQAVVWQDSGRHDAYLLRGRRLQDAEREARSRGRRTDVERDFLEACERHRHRRRLLQVVASLVLLVLLLSAVVTWAVGARDASERERDAATSGALAAQAVAHLKDHDSSGRPTGLSLYLSLEALRFRDTPEARGALLASLQTPGYSPVLGDVLASASGGVAFSPDGGTLAATGGRTVTLWDVRSQARTAELAGDGGQVTSLAFSPGGLLAAGNASGEVELWNVGSGTRVGRLAGDDGAVVGVAFSPDGSALAAAATARVELWDVGRQAPLGVLPDEGGRLTSLAFSPDGQALAVADGAPAVGLWDISRQVRVGVLAGEDGQVTSLAFSPDGRILAAGAAAGRVELWDARQRARIAVLSGDGGPVTGVAFSHDGSRLAVVDGSATVGLWDVQSRTRAAALTDETGDVGPHRRWVSTALSPDGVVAARGDDGSLQLWDAEGRSLVTLTGLSRGLTSVAFEPRGHSIAFGSSDGTISLLDSGRRDRPRYLTRPGETVTGVASVRSVAFRGDGGLLASGISDGTVALWDVASGKLVQTLRAHGDAVTSVAFSPSGRLLASGSSDRTVKLWDVASGKLAQSLTGHSDAVTSVAFSHDGKLLASGSADRTVGLWVVASGLLSQTLRDHSDEVTSVAFSPDDRFLATGSADDSVRLWDAARGVGLGPITSADNVLTGDVTGVAFSPDGAAVASASADGRAVLWDVRVEAWRERACALGPHVPGDQEWRQLFGPDFPAKRSACP